MIFLGNEYKNVLLVKSKWVGKEYVDKECFVHFLTNKLVSIDKIMLADLVLEVKDDKLISRKDRYGSRGREIDFNNSEEELAKLFLLI